jgi:P-type conjugative transfer protein TrbG
MMQMILIFLCLLLTACQSSPVELTPPLSPAKQQIEKNSILTPPSYHLVNPTDPILSKAFLEYQKTGVAKAIETNQFIQFPYNMGSQPIVNARVLELTAITLEQGEQVNSVSSGDPMRWSYSLVYSGNGDSRQAHILVKPSNPHISTDFFITTDRRAYILKLVSNGSDKYIREVRFWYPEIMNEQLQSSRSTLVAQLPDVDLNHLNFNYEIILNENSIIWKPQHIFDDGIHTYIQLPQSVVANDLPALFILNGEQKELVNYRYKTPYFIIDKVFPKAILVNGVGKHQQMISIINHSFNIG